MTNYSIVESTPHETKPNRRWVSLTDRTTVAVDHGQALKPDFKTMSSYKIASRELLTNADKPLVRLVCKAPDLSTTRDQHLIDFIFSPGDERYSVSDDGSELVVAYTVDRLDLLSAASNMEYDEISKGVRDEAWIVAWESAGPNVNIIDKFQPIPRDSSGNLTVSPFPVTVAKRN